jgi:hypothetical protein
MTDQRLVAAAAQLVEQLSLRGDLVGGHCTAAVNESAAQLHLPPKHHVLIIRDRDTNADTNLVREQPRFLADSAMLVRQPLLNADALCLLHACRRSWTRPAT